MCAGALSDIAPRHALNASKLIGFERQMTVTSKGGSPLKLSVSGMRSMDAASDVRLGSASSLCSWHSAFNRLATGAHSCLVTSVVKGQYTCSPRPELTIVGFGRPSVLQKDWSAATPSA